MSIVLAAARSPSFIEQFWPVLAAGTFGVGGVLLGKAFERRHGHEAWRRSNRLTVYSEVLAKSHAFWSVAVRIYQHPNAQQDLLNELNEAKLAFHRSLATLALLGPDEVYDRGEAIGDVMGEIAELVTRTSFDNSVPLSQSELGRRLTDADTKYTARAQSELGTAR